MHAGCYWILIVIACGHGTSDTRLGSCIQAHENDIFYVPVMVTNVVELVGKVACG